MDYNKIGVGISLDKQENTHIYLSINSTEYNTTVSQVGIINYIELIKPDKDIIFYRIDNSNYFTAKEYRIQHGYNNSFF